MCNEMWLETSNGALIDANPAVGESVYIGEIKLKTNEYVPCVFSFETYRLHFAAEKRVKYNYLKHFWDKIAAQPFKKRDRLPQLQAYESLFGWPYLTTDGVIKVLSRVGCYLYCYVFQATSISAIGHFVCVEEKRLRAACREDSFLAQLIVGLDDVCTLPQIMDEEAVEDINCVLAMAGDIELQMQGNTAIITDCRRGDGVLYVPEGVENLGRIEIYDKTTHCCIKRRIHLPNTLKYIGNGSISCLNVEGTLEIPDSVVAAPVVFDLLSGGVIVSIGKKLAESWRYWQASLLMLPPNQQTTTQPNFDIRELRIDPNENHLEKLVAAGRVIVRD